MADVSDDAIKKSYNKIISDREQANWMTISYADGSTDKFVLVDVGSDGLTEMVKSFTPTFRGYGYARIQIQGKATKFILIQYVGKHCTAFQKARTIVHEEDVVSVLKKFDAKVYASSPEDLSEDKILELFHKM